MESWLLYWLGIVTVAGLAVLGSVHVLLNKRNHYAAAIWLLILWLLPVAGFLLYRAFGVNRVARKARRRLRAAPPEADTSSVPVPEALLPLRELGDRVVRRPLLAGNRVGLLVDGDEAYPVMLKAIANARESVAFCSYIFDDDEVGRRFGDALCEAAARGVAVRLLVDGIGAWGMGPRLRRSLTDAGGRVASFWPQGRWLKHPGLNLRNHRKLLVTDGRLAFTGGLNISARHVTPRGRPLPASRDLHFRVEGPVVSHLASAFADDWELTTGERLHGTAWFPSLGTVGDLPARCIPSGPDRDLGILRDVLLGAIRVARERVDLLSPYFIPDEGILAALGTAARSGVRIRVLLAARADHRFMTWAARAHLWDLVRQGVEIREVGPGFVHGKVAVVDGTWVLFGSSNLDPRSFRLNFELNVEAWSPALAAEVTEYLGRLMSHGGRVTRRTLRREPALIRLRNAAVKLFSPYL